MAKKPSLADILKQAGLGQAVTGIEQVSKAAAPSRSRPVVVRVKPQGQSSVVITKPLDAPPAPIRLTARNLSDYPQFGDLAPRRGAAPTPKGPRFEPSSVHQTPTMRRQNRQRGIEIAAQQAIDPYAARAAKNLSPRAEAFLNWFPAVHDVAMGRPADPVGLAMDIGGLFLPGPFKGGFGAWRGARAVAGAMKAGETAADVARAGRTAYTEARPFVEGAQAAGRAARRVRTRPFYVNGVEAARIPASGSRAGRFLEHVTDRMVRPVLGETPLMLSETQKAGRAIQMTEKNISRIATAKAVALRKIGRKLNGPQQYALRLVNEGTHAAERAQFHLNQIGETTNPANKTAARAVSKE